MNHYFGDPRNRRRLLLAGVYELSSCLRPLIETAQNEKINKSPNQRVEHPVYKT